MRTVVDLNAGIGGRVTAFLQQGFKVIEVYDSDMENCQYLSRIVEAEKVKNANLMDVNPVQIQNADIFMFKYIQQSFSMARSIKIEMADVNEVIFNIIKIKLPKCIFIEVPPSTVLRNNDKLEEYLAEYQELGYLFTYKIYDESEFSGFPVYGKQAFFVGLKCANENTFMFPVPEKQLVAEMLYEDESRIDEWYRRCSFDTTKMEYSKWYLKNYNDISETSKIHMGGPRECYVVDGLGPRRFTHNELARVKGLTAENYNNCANKRRMYQKIAYASNVYIINAIASFLSGHFEDSLLKKRDKKDTQVSGKSGAINKGKKAKSEKVMFPKIQLKSIHINKLKGLENVEINLNKRLVAIMGINGAGKSTILYALACTYSKYEKGENYKFSDFFTPNPDALWNNSSLSVINYDENTGKDTTKNYIKKGKRWANYSSRPLRDVFYFGVDSCIPEIEKEKKTSYINYVSSNETGKHVDKVLNDASYILQKDYTQLVSNNTSSKKYIGVHTASGLVYSSLSMGAGEQRIIKLLQTVYNANQYSMILIDEIDLLLHVDALKKLIERLYIIAEEKKIQIIFTTHSLEMQDLREYVDIKYIEHNAESILVYESIKPDLLYELSGEIKKVYSIYVEDRFAEAIVKKTLRELQMQRYVSVIKYGAITNSFIIAAGKVIAGEDIDNILIVTDGDEYVTDEKKLEQIKNKWSGSERGKEQEWEKALSLISQFNLPENTPPEKYVHSLLVELQEDDEIIQIARKINVVGNDSHDWIRKIVEQMGDEKETYLEIMNLISKNPKWDEYVANVKCWLTKKKEKM